MHKIKKFARSITNSFWKKPEQTNWNNFAPDMMQEVANHLDDQDLRYLACVSKKWNAVAKNAPHYKKQIFYISTFGEGVRTWTFPRSGGSSSGSGPIFVPFPSINRHTHPRAKEFINTFIDYFANAKDIYLFEDYRDGVFGERFPIFKIQLKQNHFATSTAVDWPYARWKWKCKVDDIEKIIWAEVTWDENKHVRRILDLPLEQIEGLQKRINNNSI